MNMPILLSVAALAVLGLPPGMGAGPLRDGDQAPLIEGRDQDGRDWKLDGKYHLNFRLLTDTDGKIADAYGVRMPDRNMANRVSFLIGLDGKIAHVTRNSDAEVHLAEMKTAVAPMAKK
jgi:hypothetical protein